LVHWEREFKNMKYDVSLNYSVDHFKDQMVNDYKEFPFNGGKDIVGMAANSASYQNIIKTIGYDNFIKDYETHILNNKLSMLVLLSEFPKIDNDPDANPIINKELCPNAIINRELFIKITDRQKEVLSNTMKGMGFQLDREIMLGKDKVNEESGSRYWIISFIPHTLSRKQIEPMFRDIYMELMYNIKSEL